MTKIICSLLTGIVIGLFVAGYTTVYRRSCDTTRYGFSWTTQRGLDRHPFQCKDSNQVIEREHNPFIRDSK